MAKKLTYGKLSIILIYRAIGCLLCELADGNPLLPGENEVD
jgi:hypothetical protein